MKITSPAIIFSAPSGAGKSTLINSLLEAMPETFEFSISVTSRSPRGDEKSGVEYYFVSSDKFKELITNGMLLEWQEVYQGTFYGTLKSELFRISQNKKCMILDIDVVGATNVMKEMPEALTIFVKPPSIEILADRLQQRSLDTPEAIVKRIKKATLEMEYEDRFAKTIVNDNLENSKKDVLFVVKEYLNRFL